MSEIWTAVSEKDDKITFEVKDESTGKIRKEERYKKALPLMMEMGGYPSVVGKTLTMQKLPWRFRKQSDNIYLDGPSIGVDSYHPIDA